MENNQEMDQTLPEQEQPVEEQKGYVPRPAWQVWGARIGLVVFILFLILEYARILWGGA